jgi:hypothetical protein
LEPVLYVKIFVTTLQSTAVLRGHGYGWAFVVFALASPIPVGACPREHFHSEQIAIFQTELDYSIPAVFRFLFDLKLAQSEAEQQNRRQTAGAESTTIEPIYG